MIKDYFNLAFRNLRKRKLRSWLTILGIVISIATIFMLISLSIGLEGAVKEQFRLLGADKFFVQPQGQLGGPGAGSAVQLTEKDVEVIEKVNGVKEVSYSTFGSAEVEFQNQKRYTFSVGYPLDKAEVFGEIELYKAEEGRILEEGDEGKVMIGSQYKHNNFFKKPVKVGDKLSVNGKQFEVKGILETVGNPTDDRIIYMSLTDFREIFNTGDRVDQIIVQVNDENEINGIAERTERKLRRFRNVDEKNQDFTILTPEELLESFAIILNIITGFLLSIATISLIVGGIGIANTMYTSVLERTREIGIMKAVGARNKDVMFIFLIESGLLGLVGGLIGILLGMGIGRGIEYIAVNQLGTTLLQVEFPGYLILGCLAFSFLIGAVSGTLPAWKASKTNVVDALRYE